MTTDKDGLSAEIAEIVKRREGAAYKRGWIKGMLFTHGMYGAIGIGFILFLRR